MFHRPRSSAARDWVVGCSSGFFDSGSTAALTGARRGSSLSTVRTSTPPLAFEAKKGRPAEGMAEIACPDCGTQGAWTEPQLFSGLVKTYLGPVDNEEGLHYMRPETAQGIFVNFLNVLGAARKKPPFGIGQIGKAFRN